MVAARGCEWKTGSSEHTVPRQDAVTVCSSMTRTSGRTHRARREAVVEFVAGGGAAGAAQSAAGRHRRLPLGQLAHVALPRALCRRQPPLQHLHLRVQGTGQFVRGWHGAQATLLCPGSENTGRRAGRRWAFCFGTQACSKYMS